MAAKKSRYPAIPAGKGRDDALKQTAEILTGARGDGLDRALTPRDLLGPGVRLGGGGRGLIPWPGGGSGDAPSQVIDAPTKPEGVAAAGAFETIFVTWGAPTYRGHAYAEVWRSGTDDFGTAVRIGTQTGSLFADVTGMGAEFYYWVRFVNLANQEGPLHATAGVYAETAPNITQIMDDIGDEINETHLAQALNSRINLIDAPATGLVDVVNGHSQQLIQLDDGQSSLQQQIESLSVSSDVQVFYQPDEPSGAIAENARWFDTDDGNRPYLYKDGVWVETTDQRILQNAAAILSEQTARISADGALANRTDALEAAVNHPVTGVAASAAAINSTQATVTGHGNTLTAHTQQMGQIQAIVGEDFAALQTMYDVTAGPNGISAEYFLKSDVNGYVAGWGLLNDGTTATAVWRTDRFVIGMPGASDAYPFIYDAGALYLDTLMVKDGSITNAKIGNLSADKITTGTLDADRIGANSITAQKIDTRGLSIRDELGNIILASGTALDHSYVYGLGSLATKNSVSYGDVSGSKPPINAQVNAPGIGIRINFINWTSHNAGEAVLHGFDANGNAANIPGYVWWQGQKVTVPPPAQNQINPSQAGPFYILLDKANRQAWAGHSVTAARKDNGAWTYRAHDSAARTGAVAIDADILVIGEIYLSSSEMISHGAMYTEALSPHVVPDAGATVGAEFGRNISGKITRQNASTYIANLAVDTLQIAGNAVTIPVAAGSNAYTSLPVINSSQVGDPPWHNIGAVQPAGAPNGTPVLLQASLTLALNVSVFGRIRIAGPNGFVTNHVNWWGGNYGGITNYTLNVVGTHVYPGHSAYVLQFSGYTQNFGGVLMPVSAQSWTLSAMGVKR